MKKLILILLMQWGLAAAAQINTNLIMGGNPPSTLTEWGNRKDLLILQVQRGLGVRFDYKIKTEIRLLDGTVVARNDLSKATVYQLGSANVLYYASEVMQLEIMQFNGKYKQAYERTGKLISETYQICVRLVNATDLAPLSDEKCRSFYVANLQLPILMKPSPEEELDYEKARTAIIFRWSPVVPMQTTPVVYRIMAFEVLPNQNPVQAMRSNQPILDKEVIGTTQYIWTPQGILDDIMNRYNTENNLRMLDSPRRGIGPDMEPDLDIVKNDSLNQPQQKAGVSTSRAKVRCKMVWTIQALDAARKPLLDGNINGDAISEPQVFILNRMKASLIKQ